MARAPFARMLRMTQPPRLILIAQGFISGMMACLMTGIFGVINHGIDADFPALWARAIVMAWPIAFVLSLGVGPVAFALAYRVNRLFG